MRRPAGDHCKISRAADLNFPMNTVLPMLDDDRTERNKPDSKLTQERLAPKVIVVAITIAAAAITKADTEPGSARDQQFTLHCEGQRRNYSPAVTVAWSNDMSFDVRGEGRGFYDWGERTWRKIYGKVASEYIEITPLARLDSGLAAVEVIDQNSGEYTMGYSDGTGYGYSIRGTCRRVSWRQPPKALF
jgi:hypothetical protein